MAGDRTVEFILRARDEASRTIKALEQAVGGFDQTQEDAADNLAQTNAEFAELRNSAAALKTAYDTLKGTLAGVQKVLRQQQTIGELNADLQKQADLLAETAAKQKQAAATAAQASSAYTQQAARVRDLQGELAQLDARQKQLADTAGIAGRFQKIAAEIEKYEAQQAKARQRVEELTAAIRRQEQVKAAAERAGKATSFQDAKLAAYRKELDALNYSLSNLSKTGGVEQRLQKLYSELDKLGDRARKLGVDTTELAKPLAQIEAELAGTAARSQALQPTLARLTGELAYLKGEATAAAAALRTASGDTATQQANYDRLAAKIERLTAAIAPLEAQLKQAGVATDRLADEQNRLQVETEQTAKASRSAEAAVRGQVREHEQLNKRLKNGIELQRTSLSLYQRFRGQVLSLTAAYIGLYGVVQQISTAFQAGAQVRGIENTLNAANGGDIKLAQQELQYTKDLANALGLEYTALGQSYAKYRAAIADKMPLEEQRFIFEAIAKAGVTLRLSTEDMQGTYTALIQMFSKGVISMEELRQQLGDRLPGAVRLLSEGLGITEKELFKLVETGNLTSDNLLFLAKNLNKVYGGNMAKALEAPQVQLNRLKNQITELRVEFEKAAEQAGLGPALAEITAALSKPEFKEGVRSLAQAFVAIVKVIPTIIENFGALYRTLIIITGAKVTLGIVSMVANFRLLSTVLAESAAASVLLEKGMKGAIARGTGIVGILATLYFYLDSLSSSNGSFRRAIAFFVSLIDEGITRIKYGFPLAFEVAKYGLLKLAQAIEKELIDKFNQFILKAANLAYELGLEDLAKAAGRNLILYNRTLKAEIGKSEQEIKRLAEAQKAAIAEIEGARVEMAKEATADAVSGKKTGFGLTGDPSPDASPVLPPTTPKDKDTVDALERLYERLQNKIFDINAEIAADEAKTVDERLAVVRTKYAELFDDIEKLRASGRFDQVKLGEFEATINRRILQQQAEESRKFLDDQLALAQARLDAILAERDAKISIIEGARERGDITDNTAEQQIGAMSNQYLPRLGAAYDDVADAAERVRDAAVTTEDYLAADQLVTKIEADKARLVEYEKKLFTTAQLQEKFADAGVGMFDAFTEGLGDALAGVGDLGDAFDAAGKAFLQFAADFIREIARMILRQAILNALAGSFGGGPGLDASQGSFFANVAHSGGVVGNGSMDRTRNVAAEWFSNAARYHTGGVVGLKSDEVPAILQRDEEVLTKDDPRHRRNGGLGKGGDAAPTPQDIKIINAIDGASVLEAALSTKAGQKVFINFVRANRGSLRTVLN